MRVRKTGAGRGPGCRRVRWPALIVCVGLVLLGTACGEEPTAEAPVTRPVKMLTIGNGGTAGTLEYPGEVSAAAETVMAFEVSGRIIEFPVSEGQQVGRGALLVRMDPRNFQAARDAESAKVKAARAEFERKQALYETDSISLQELEVAQRNYEVAEATLRNAEKVLGDTLLRAPFAGTVARTIAENFQNVTAKEPILELQGGSGMDVEVNIPEGDWQFARPGISADESARRVRPIVTVSAYPDRPIPATFKEMSTTADPATRTFRITLHFDPPDDLTIRSGMTAMVRITVPDRGSEVVQVPSRAIVSDDAGAAFVWVVDPESMKVRRAPVVLGELSGEDVEIRSGLETGDVIAISGVHNLRDGMSVRRFES